MFCMDQFPPSSPTTTPVKNEVATHAEEKREGVGNEVVHLDSGRTLYSESEEILSTPTPPVRDVFHFQMHVGKEGGKGDTGLDRLPGFGGRPGVNGLPGPKGESGLPGQCGISGEPGRHGVGILGVAGISGEPGREGLSRGRGQFGTKGDEGVPGYPGMKGPRADAGHPRWPGQEGLPGMKGVGIPSEAGISGEPGREGLSGGRGPFETKGDEGVPGYPGMKGERGPRADAGRPRWPGQEGLPGMKGKVENEIQDLKCMRKKKKQKPSKLKCSMCTFTCLESMRNRLTRHVMVQHPLSNDNFSQSTNNDMNESTYILFYFMFVLFICYLISSYCDDFFTFVS